MEKSQTLVKQAKPSEFGVVLDLYKKGLEEIGFEYVESLLVKKIVNSWHLAPCFLMGDYGMAGFTTVISSHDGKARLADYMFYVEPEHRNIKTLGRLVEAAKDFAKDQNMPLRLEFLSHNDEQLKKRVLKIHGFDVVAIVGEYNGRR